jgi:5'-methylthioadenosine phosphorylase
LRVIYKEFYAGDFMPGKPERAAIIGGTGVYQLPDLKGKDVDVETPYGGVNTIIVDASPFPVVFLNRHGPNRLNPPHSINYRGNIHALHKLGVRKILAINAVGSINRKLPPLSIVMVDDFLDFTSGRVHTFFDGGPSGHAYTEMNSPYCPGLRRQMLDLAPQFNLRIHPGGVYVCTNGPRFETPAEIRMFEKLGGDVVGMTSVPEVNLARELGMHYASAAYSINWAAGIEDQIGLVTEGVSEMLASLTSLMIKTLEQKSIPDCECMDSVMMVNPPQKGGVYRSEN